MARKIERPAPTAAWGADRSSSVGGGAAMCNTSTILIFVMLFIASLNAFFAYNRISNAATALNNEVLKTRHLLAVLGKHRSIAAPLPIPTIVAGGGLRPPPAGFASKAPALQPAKPQILHGLDNADPILKQLKKPSGAKKGPPATLKPDLIGNRGNQPIDDALIDRIKAEVKRVDAEREQQGRGWLKVRPTKDDAAGTAPKLRIAIASLNARGVQKQGGPQQGAGAGGPLNKRPDWQHRHAAHNKLEYCKKWGYDLIIEDNSIVDTTRDVAWSKIPIFKKWLPQYDYVMWMDMDAFFMRFDIPIEAFIRDETKDVIIAKDWHGINLGVMIMRNSDFSFTLLDDMWAVPRHMWEPWQEQSALMKLLDTQFAGSAARAREASFYYIEQRDMNAYPQHFAYGNARAMYLDGDPIAHFPNCKAFPQCKSLIERFYTVSCKVNGLDVLGNDPIIPMRIVPVLPEMKVHSKGGAPGGKRNAATPPPPVTEAAGGDGEVDDTPKPAAKDKKSAKDKKAAKGKKGAATPPTTRASDEEEEETAAPPPPPKKVKSAKKPKTLPPADDESEDKV